MNAHLRTPRSPNQFAPTANGHCHAATTIPDWLSLHVMATRSDNDAKLQRVHARCNLVQSWIQHALRIQNHVRSSNATRRLPTCLVTHNARLRFAPSRQLIPFRHVGGGLGGILEITGDSDTNASANPNWRETDSAFPTLQE